MKISDVFWNAAQLIGDEPSGAGPWGCCRAIAQAQRFWESDGQLFFAKLFKPAHRNLTVWWWADKFTSEDQEARRLALLFAYYIAKDEGL